TVFNQCPEDPDLYYCDPTLVNVATIESENAAKAPTMLWLTDEMEAYQYANGTWSSRFDSSSPVNKNPVVTVASWWIVIMLCGFATYPLLFSLFPALADRGYAFSKFMGMFLAGWITWYLASIRIPVWWQGGIIVPLILMFIVGMILLWRGRTGLLPVLRPRWGRRLVGRAVRPAAGLLLAVARPADPASSA